MKRPVLAALLAALSLSASATVLTFDDYPGAVQNGDGHMRDAYHGYLLSADVGRFSEGLPVLDWIDTVDTPWWDFGAVSGDFTAINNYGGMGIIRKEDGGNFVFGGLWARVWDDYEDARDGVLRGLKDGTEVWSVDVQIGQAFINFGGMDGAIDELQIDLGTSFLIDDVTLRDAPQQGNVPEPGSLALFGLGLAGAAALRRKRAA